MWERIVSRWWWLAQVRWGAGSRKFGSALKEMHPYATHTTVCTHHTSNHTAHPVQITVMCWESANGTNELRGQFPELYIRPLQGLV